MNKIKNNLLSDYLWIIFLLLGIIGSVAVLFLTPLKQEINNSWHFYSKILVYVLLCLGVSFFPNRSKHWYLLIFVLFLICLGFIIPRIAYIGVMLFTSQGLKPFNQYYTLIYIILYPLITLIGALGYRVGGGTAGNTFKIAFGGQIFLLSGYLDLMWLIINNAEKPKILTHAHHIKIIIGHFPTFNETIIFALLHIPVFVLLILLPLDEWFQKFLNYHERNTSVNICSNP